MKLPKEQHDRLIALGFQHDDVDPEFPYFYDLMNDEYGVLEDEEKLQLLINASPAIEETISISVGGIAFINIRIKSPEDAIEWAKSISGFTPN